MKVIPYCEVPKGAWNELHEKSDGAWLFHRHEWVELEAQYFAETNYSFAIVRGNGEIVGIHPLYFRHAGERLLDSGMHRHTGLALRSGLVGSDIKAARTLAMNHIFGLAEQYRVDRIQLNTHNLAPQNLSNRREEIPFWVTEHGFYLGLYFTQHGLSPVPSMATCCADQIVHLEELDEAALFKNLEESCQRAVRKAVKSGLRIAIGRCESDIDAYYELAQTSAQRTGEDLPPREYYFSIYKTLNPLGKCEVLFALSEGKRIGALFLLLDKRSVNFMAGVSCPDYLRVRVNDFMHWSVIKWAKENGYAYYRLGPVFPEIDREWPISKVSRFKKKFGGRNALTIQGSFFLKPEKYFENAKREIDILCKKGEEESPPSEAERRHHSSNIPILPNPRQAEGLPIILSHYGLIDFPFSSLSDSDALPESFPLVLFITQKANVAGLQCRIHAEPGKQLYYAGRKPYHFLSSRKLIYHALLPHTTFSGNNMEPVWVNEAGRAVVAWHTGSKGKTLLVGLDVEEEIIRHRQGDPAKVDEADYKGGLGFDYERPNYLFNDQIVTQHRTQPWADNLGFFLAERFSQLTGHPLVEPLPDGAKGLVILTGDDDQASLEKYEEQLRTIGNLTITYFIHPKTRHTPETIKKLPPQVELGVHPDALDEPEAYDKLCAEQVKQIRQLTGTPIRTVRNHGFLNRGYLGHLKAWEENDLCLDVNYPGVDGTAINASFLPMRVRRPDLSWSNHYSLLTLFGDGMIYALGLTQHQAAKRIKGLSKQIETSHPGVIVLNFHPENIEDTRELHKEVLHLAHRPGWMALGLNTYLGWLDILGTLCITPLANKSYLLTSPKQVNGLVLRYPTTYGWRKMKLEPWSGKTEVHLN